MYTTFLRAHKPGGLEGEKVHEAPGQLCEAVPGEPLLGLGWQSAMPEA